MLPIQIIAIAAALICVIGCFSYSRKSKQRLLESDSAPEGTSSPPEAAQKQRNNGFKITCLTIAIIAVIAATISYCYTTGNYIYDPPDVSFIELLDEEEVIAFLEYGTGIIAFSFDECPWCQNAIPVLAEAADEMGLEYIYTYDPRPIRSDIPNGIEGTEGYYEILKLLDRFLSDYVNLEDGGTYGEKRLYVPDVYAVNEGEIMAGHSSTVASHTDPEIPLDDAQHLQLINIYKDMISKVMATDQ